MQNNYAVLISILAAINLIAFILVGMDKKRSVDSGERIREVYLFFIAIFFASLGVFFGMLFFHHKTKKIYFVLGMLLLAVQQGLLVYLLNR